MKGTGKEYQELYSASQCTTLSVRREKRKHFFFLFFFLFLFLLYHAYPGGEYVAFGSQITNFLGNTLKLGQLFAVFSDIRKNPTISLPMILSSVFLMPFFGLTSLLALDTLARNHSFKRLFDCKRKMVVSDSTIARVLRWIRPEESKQFLLSLLPSIEELGLMEKALEPGGVPRRIGIIDGSVMGTHHLVTFSLHGSIDYPILVEDQKKRGKELPTAMRILNEAHRRLNRSFPDLILCDSLYFNKKAFTNVRSKGSHILIKSSRPDFRSVLQDAQFDLEHNTTREFKTESGFDSERMCHWSIKKTSGEFAGYPIQIVHLVEDFSKRTKNKHCECWIVTSDLSLTCRSLREAAHLRWHIENHVFKRISHLAGTKRFYFKDPRPFFTMLKLLFAALAAFDAYICSMKQSASAFKRLLNGAKPTWKIIFSRLRDQLEDAAFLW